MENVTHTPVLKAKKIVIIGGSSGIGFATALAAAQQQADIIIISSNQTRIDSALKQLPGNAIGYAVDVTNEAHVKNVFEKIGAFDHLIFTAGENLMLNTIKETDMEAARNFFNVRYWGAFTAVKYAAPYLSKKGSVVLTGGLAGKRPHPAWALGASICAGMEGFTRAMAVELAPIRVNLVSPGIVKTDLWSNMPAAQREQMYEHMGNTLLVKHAGTAAEIAKTYVYLMEQTYSTGQTIVVDGGGSLV